MRRITLATALCLVGIAHAQTLYRCAAHGVNSYQQSPCPSSSRMVGSIETTPDPPPTDAQRRARIEKAEQDRAESAFLSHLAGTDHAGVMYRTTASRSSNRSGNGRTPQGDSCTTARAARKAALKAIGLGRTYDMLRQLDAAVSEACRRG